ncbi:MAG: hypothetical protein K0Q68_291 [Moraxellaceae bacterium]|nr:hypothetical protein [Moraxellaceae bacterium]
MRDILALIDETTIDCTSSYIISYKHLLGLLSSLQRISEGDVVRACHMVYGWMPTILELGQGKDRATASEAADMLEQARAGHPLCKEKLVRLSGLVNNSMVGASKLLHFCAPENYAIWDSRIYFFLYGKKPHHYQVNNPTLYIQYLSSLKEIAARAEFSDFHRKVNAKIGYPVTSLRAIEIIMFENGRFIDG